MGDATSVPFADKAFDAVMFIDSGHHFTQEEFAKVVKESYRVAKHFVIISDIVKTPDQGRISRFLYKIDRGSYIRSADEIHRILKEILKDSMTGPLLHKTFPGFYTHAVFICRKQ